SLDWILKLTDMKIAHFAAMGSMNSIKPERTEEAVAEGRNLNLTCTYEGAAYNIQWYRQYQRSRPEFLLYITEQGQIHPVRSDFSAHINSKEKRVDLEIKSAAVSDSAVYYCALQPTVTGNTKTLLHNIHQRGTHPVSGWFTNQQYIYVNESWSQVSQWSRTSTHYMIMDSSLYFLGSRGRHSVLLRPDFKPSFLTKDIFKAGFR
uniref:Ig-like domain-containing protein n=1 Tax=Mastacembelus armatus TaxID=205130 RepID=A0A3Q3RUW7_9TELE